MVGFGPEMLRKVGMVWSLTGVQPSPGFPDLANSAQAPVKTSRTRASWTGTGLIRHDKSLGYQTHVSRKFVILSVPVVPKHWLPFIDEVIGVGHTVLIEEMKRLD